MSLLYKKEDIL